MPAVPGQPGLRGTRDVERAIVACDDELQELLGRADVHAGPVGLGQRHAVRLRHVLVHHQPLRDGREGRDVARQRIDQRCVASHRRHAPGCV